MTRIRGWRVGCSGWQYRDWRGRFYPSHLPARAWLEFYATRFDTVEVNNTFYRLPDLATFVNWRRRTPAGFLVAVKASRYLTHLKRLTGPAEPLRRLFGRLRGLQDKLGPVLYQLPGTMRRDLPRLEQFLDRLPAALRVGRRVVPVRHVIEFREPSWYVADVFDLLREREVALCLHDRAGSAVGKASVGPFVYLRLHGVSGAYHGEYGRRRLERWAGWLAEQCQDGREAFAYFNNDVDGAATRDAARLRDMLARRCRRNPPGGAGPLTTRPASPTDAARSACRFRAASPRSADRRAPDRSGSRRRRR
jgi:uncharacterized protein YecE (DUF72 family)